jgi:Family of unknown function (DUF6364)
MDSKLTLRLDEHTIKMAKAHAARRGTSVSKLVEAFFTQLNEPLPNIAGEAAAVPMTSVTHRLHGIVAGQANVADDINGRGEYRAHLEKKHR